MALDALVHEQELAAPRLTKADLLGLVYAGAPCESDQPAAG